MRRSFSSIKRIVSSLFPSRENPGDRNASAVSSLLIKNRKATSFPPDRPAVCCGRGGSERPNGRPWMDLQSPIKRLSGHTDSLTSTSVVAREDVSLPASDCRNISQGTTDTLTNEEIFNFRLLQVVHSHPAGGKHQV